jgi:hypothetical protein
VEIGLGYETDLVADILNPVVVVAIQIKRHLRYDVVLHIHPADEPIDNRAFPRSHRAMEKEVRDRIIA